jgi:hypothetical protein
MKLRLVGTLVLASCLAVCAAASAYAGNGNGKDNGNGENDAPAVVAQADEGHGHSANAPGQVKKDEAAAEAQVQASAPAQQAASGPAQGVKPSNDTAHETHAAAASDKTKLYGNGATAGQIAIQKGAAPSTSLHGPGNSQPHKASPCAGGHEVDVHALKGKRSGSCGSPGPSPHPTPVPDPGPSPRPLTSPSSDPGSPPAASGGSAPSGSVVGVGFTPKPMHGSTGSAGSGILGATGVPARGVLPFTGLDLWSAVFVGATLILIGLALCRRARTVPACESEQEPRP